MKATDARKELLKDDEFRREYETQKLALETAHNIIITRAKAELSQSQLAELVGTKQPSIARAESGNSLPSLVFLKRIADALGKELTAPKFVEPNAELSFSGSVVMDKMIREPNTFEHKTATSVIPMFVTGYSVTSNDIEGIRSKEVVGGFYA